MTNAGQRASPGAWNNFNSGLNQLTGGSVGHPYQGCIDQSNTMAGALSGGQYDDKWTFSSAGSDSPHVEPQSLLGANLFPHHWLTGQSSNPNDPTLIIDPYNNIIMPMKH